MWVSENLSSSLPRRNSPVFQNRASVVRNMRPPSNLRCRQVADYNITSLATYLLFKQLSVWKFISSALGAEEVNTV